MRRNIPQTDAPIATEIVADIADDFATDSETVQEIVDAAQELWAHDFDLNREQFVVAETEEIIITLSEWGFSEEADQLLGDYGPTLDINGALEDDLGAILSQAHHAAFDTAAVRSITGYDRQQVTGATSANYPRIIRKPEDAKPTTGAVDVDYRIQYEHGYERPYNFVARATATVSGDYGTLEIERTYRGCPDDNADESRDEIHMSSEARHVESDTLVNDAIETWSIEEQLPPKRGRVIPGDDDLRRFVYENHVGDIEQEYEAIRDTIHICEECGAYPSDHVKVEQRPTYNVDPSVPDSMCNHCYASMLTEITALSQQEAEVYALKESSLSHSQIADALGGLSKSQVGTVMSRVRDKQSQSERTAELISA